MASTDVAGDFRHASAMSVNSRDGVRLEFEPLDFRTTPQVIEHEIQSMLDESIPMFSSNMRRERLSMA